MQMTLLAASITDTDLLATACKTSTPKKQHPHLLGISLGNGVKDNVQVYNIPKFDGYHERQQPPVLSDNIAEIEAFSRVRIRAQIEIEREPSRC